MFQSPRGEFWFRNQSRAIQAIEAQGFSLLAENFGLETSAIL